MLNQRILTALVAAALLLIVLFAVPPPAARAIILAAILTAAWEWSGFLAAPGPALRIAYTGVMALLLVAVGGLAASGALAPASVFVVALAAWLLALLWLFVYPTPVPPLLTWLAGVLVLLPAWLALDGLYRRGPAVLLFLLVIVWAADIGAYFAGKSFGRVRLAPRISPGKTWEGVLGGLLLVMILAMAGSYWLDRPAVVLVPFCVAVALLSVVGDLTVSMFKRNAGIKDSGTLFPGHGGLLDRIDSVAPAAPLFALGSAWTGVS